MKFRREPCSAHQMLVALARLEMRAVSPRGRRLLLHWWRRGIEQQVENYIAGYING